MAIPNVDTFEYDIADEIKRKEASVGDIASATGDIGNSPKQTSFPIIITFIGILLIVIIISISFFSYTYFYKKREPTIQNKTTTENTRVNDASLLSTLSPLFPDAFGRFVSGVEKNEYGYNITITSYSPVFAYMFKNENVYADDIALAVGSARDTSTTTPSFYFSDVTINNQNMRIGTSDTNTIVYAFVSTTNLVIASSTSAILALRSTILH